MRFRSPLLFVTLACASGGGGWWLDSTATLAEDAGGMVRRDLAALLPDTCWSHLILDGGPCVDRGDKLLITRFLQDPEVVPFVRSFGQAILARGSEVEGWCEQYLGLSLEDTVRLLQYRVSVGWCGFLPNSVDRYFPMGVPDLLITLEFGDDLEVVRRLMFALEKAVLAWGSGSFVDDEIGGMPVRRYVPSRPQTPSAWYFLRDRTLLLGTSRDTLAGVVHRMKSGATAGSLREQARFQQSARGLQADAVASLYVQLPPILKQLEAEVPRVVWEWFRASGLDGFESLAYSLAPDGVGFRDRLFLNWRPGSARTGLEVRGPGKVPSMVPDSTGFLISGGLDLDQVLAWVKRTAADRGMDRAVDALVAQASDLINVDLELDVLPHLPKEWAAFASWPRNASLPDVGLLLVTPDGASLMDVCEDGLDQARVECEFLEHRGQRLLVVETDDAPFGTFRLRPTMTAFPDRLVVTLWPQAAKNLIDHGLDGGKTLVQRQEYRTAYEMWGRGEAGYGAATMWVDMKGAVGFACDNGVPLAQTLLPGDRDASVNWALFPLTTTVQGYFEGIVLGGEWISDGLLLDAWSSTGLLASALAPVGLTWWARDDLARLERDALVQRRLQVLEFPPAPRKGGR